MAKTHNYTLTKISRLKQAKIIDYINEFCINYYLKEHDTIPRIQNLDTPINKKFKLHSIGTELLLNIMIKEKYVNAISSDDGQTIDSLDCNSNGFALYFNGGLTKKVKHERNKKWLIIIGQISAIIVGVYYLLLSLEKLSPLLHFIFCD